MERTITPTFKSEKLLSHGEFLQQYVLNRALGNEGGLEGGTAANEADSAWKQIQYLIKNEKSKSN